jgi:hypothetical protein
VSFAPRWCSGGCCRDLELLDFDEIHDSGGICWDCFLHFEEKREAESEAAHERGMEKWARAYDELNGAPESEEDR